MENSIVMRNAPMQDGEVSGSGSASMTLIAMRNEKQMVLDNYDQYLRKNQPSIKYG